MAAIINALVEIRPHLLRATGANRIEFFEFSLFPALGTAPLFFLRYDIVVKHIA